MSTIVVRESRSHNIIAAFNSGDFFVQPSHKNRPPGYPKRRLKYWVIKYSKWEKEKVLIPSRVHHFLYLLIDKLTVFRLDYEEIVSL